jgi:hypothetical protein
LLNFDRKRPVLALAVANPPAEEWLIGELQDQMDIINTHAESALDLSELNVDVILVARKVGPDVGLLDIGTVMETAVSTKADVIAILSQMDEEGQMAAETANRLGITHVITCEVGSVIGADEVLNTLLSYEAEWQERRRQAKQAATKEHGAAPRISIPLFGSSKKEPEAHGHLIGVSSARGSGGTMVAWNLATALAKKGEEVALLTAGADPSLAKWVKFSDTRRAILTGPGEDTHFGVNIGVSENAMEDDEWMLAARLSESVRVIVDLTGIENPPLNRVETLIHVRDCDPSHDVEPEHDHLIRVLNRIPDGLPISASDVLGHRPELTIREYFNQYQSMWTGKPLVLEHEELAVGLVSLLGEHVKMERVSQVEKKEDESCNNRFQFSLS